MDNTTEQTNSQLSPEEAKAALGNASFLQEQLLAQMNPMGDQMMGAGEPTSPVEPQEAPEKEEEPSEDSDSLKKEFDGKLEGLKKEVKDMVKSELADIKDGIKKLLEEENGEDED